MAKPKVRKVFSAQGAKPRGRKKLFLPRAETLNEGVKPNSPRPAIQERHSYMHSICAKVEKNLDKNRNISRTGRTWVFPTDQSEKLMSDRFVKCSDIFTQFPWVLPTGSAQWSASSATLKAAFFSYLKKAPFFCSGEKIYFYLFSEKSAFFNDHSSATLKEVAFFKLPFFSAFFSAF